MNSTKTLKVFKPLPTLPPVGVSSGPVRWLHINFFSSPFSILATVLGCAAVILYVPSMLQWAVIDATWSGGDRSYCEAQPTGACWIAIRVRILQVLFGLFYSQYPDEIWRPILTTGLLVLFSGPLFISGFSRTFKLRLGIFLLFIFPFFGYALIHGEWLGLRVAATSQWGGLMLTLILALIGIVASLPIGIALALGRRSDMPVLRWLSIVFIEFWRANPLITVLFMMSNLLPLFFPAEMEFDKVGRALVGITLFQSAYTAEAVRGGLAAIPRGQFEAADAMGLGYWQSMRLIILPQALKISIPGIVNTFIELFKDTSLVSIIGLLDLFRIAQTISRSIEWKGYDFETYIFSALVYFVFCFSISKYSQRIEKKLDTSYAE